jgi:hypothetical protein
MLHSWWASGDFGHLGLVLVPFRKPGSKFGSAQIALAKRSTQTKYSRWIYLSSTSSLSSFSHVNGYDSPSLWYGSLLFRPNNKFKVARSSEIFFFLVMCWIFADDLKIIAPYRFGFMILHKRNSKVTDGRHRQGVNKSSMKNVMTLWNYNFAYTVCAVYEYRNGSYRYWESSTWWISIKHGLPT